MEPRKLTEPEKSSNISQPGEQAGSLTDPGEAFEENGLYGVRNRKTFADFLLLKDEI